MSHTPISPKTPSNNVDLLHITTGEALLSQALTGHSSTPRVSYLRSESPYGRSASPIAFDGLSFPSVGARDRREDTEVQRAARIEKISGAVRTILECIGEDPDREGLLKTPERYAKALMFFSKGYEESVTHLMNKALFQEDHDEMVIVKNIDVFSLCEHHMVPFTGKIHIGYIPKNGKVVGLSKIARLAEMFSRRLQVQERLTKQVAMALQELLDPLGVAVVMEARNLANKDGLGKSDPQVLLYVYDDHTRSWGAKPYAKTERIKDSLNPEFVNGLQVDYHFETVQKLRFVVYDIDAKYSENLDHQDYLGEAITDLGSIIGAQGNRVALPLVHPKHRFRGHIIIRAEEMSLSKRVITLSMRGIDLTKKGLFKSRPSAFVVIQRSNENGTFSPVYKSDHVESDDDPKWKPITIKESLLCNGDPNRQLKIEIMSRKDSGAHTLIGATGPFTVNELSHRQFPFSMPIPPMPNPSALVIQSFSVTEPPSFLDFMAGGGTVGLCVAIDFTQSNGDPKSPQSLHYRSPTGENEYTRAIRSVGNVLQCYDADKKFPVFGFGGRINGQVSHAFALNGNPSNPEVYGVEGILDAYWRAHSFVELYGPTNFSSVISEATKIASHHEPYGYTTLLILTDGAITDMDATKKALKVASDHALSVIIIGIGHANFSNMNDLDGDGEIRKKGRDIVQFVAAREYPPHKEHGLSQALLAEIPDQMMGYLTRNNIQPQPPIRVDTATLLAAASSGMPVPHVVGGVVPPVDHYPGAAGPSAAMPQYAPPSGPPPAAAGPSAAMPHYAPPSGPPPAAGIYPHSQQYAVQPTPWGQQSVPGSAPNPGYYPYNTPPQAPGQQLHYSSQHSPYPFHPSQYPPHHQQPGQAYLPPGQAYPPQLAVNGSYAQSYPTQPQVYQPQPVQPGQAPRALNPGHHSQPGNDGSSLLKDVSGRGGSPSFPVPQPDRNGSPNIPVPQPDRSGSPNIPVPQPDRSSSPVYPSPQPSGTPINPPQHLPHQPEQGQQPPTVSQGHPPPPVAPVARAPQAIVAPENTAMEASK
ncbi:hypothetical protein BGX27_005847 [Mortierella sp. AM989]|nr:hypothetical protein BGX27_005847 [Mortierella sp. AM989]